MVIWYFDQVTYTYTEEDNNCQDSILVFMVSDLTMVNFPNNVLETAGFWCIIRLTAILRLLQRKNSIFL